jgi:hypothetical protein
MREVFDESNSSEGGVYILQRKQWDYHIGIFWRLSPVHRKSGVSEELEGLMRYCQSNRGNGWGISVERNSHRGPVEWNLSFETWDLRQFGLRSI